jgi:hypothetical protein
MQYDAMGVDSALLETSAVYAAIMGRFFSQREADRAPDYILSRYRHGRSVFGLLISRLSYPGGSKRRMDVLAS